MSCLADKNQDIIPSAGTLVDFGCHSARLVTQYHMSQKNIEQTHQITLNMTHIPCTTPQPHTTSSNISNPSSNLQLQTSRPCTWGQSALGQDTDVPQHHNSHKPSSSHPQSMNQRTKTMEDEQN